ncbi:unnamed protein product [Eruca vesicaria subsp. sativa]|uniref:Uncharacterized protein n=1 Tax=Eruca vesicaria subsp. sativa TaxID=29727 RepID=A0ABC8LDL8_ERUVS|nr:unnamed protein product [Eruca vesicaria subsp. sativa]
MQLLSLVFLFSACWLFLRVIWMVGGRRIQQKLRWRRGLFVTVLPVVLPSRFIIPSAMSGEDSLAVASVCRQTSHAVHYVQAFQSFSECRYQTTSSNSPSAVRLELHKTLWAAPILQTGVRSRIITGTYPKFFDILSLPPYGIVMLFSLPLILFDDSSLLLR